MKTESDLYYDMHAFSYITSLYVSVIYSIILNMITILFIIQFMTCSFTLLNSLCYLFILSHT